MFISDKKATQSTVSTPPYSAANLEKLPATIPLLPGSTYDVYAVGECSDGRNSERSNSIVVESQIQISETKADPNAPTVVSAAPKTGAEWDSVTIVWTPGADSVPSAGDPAFFVTCVPAGTACPTNPVFDINRPIGQRTDDVTGLSPSTLYDCYVVAKNSQGVGVCSSKVTATTANNVVQQVSSPQILSGESLSASSEGFGFPASLGFDGNYGSFWHSAWPTYNNGIYTGSVKTSVDGGQDVPGEWLQIQFPKSILMTKFSISPRSGWEHRMPYNGRVVASNDGSTWSTIKSWTGQSGYTYGVDTDFEVSNNNNYFKYYRIISEEAYPNNSDSSCIQIAQWKIFGLVSSS